MGLSNSEIPDNFEYSYFSLNVLSQAIVEMETLSKCRHPNDLALFSGHLGRFYYFTLKYAFVMELCKLMEPDGNRRNTNYASLSRLNKKVLNLRGKSYKEAFNEIERSISSLQQSEFVKIVKEELRIKDLPTQTRLHRI